MPKVILQLRLAPEDVSVGAVRRHLGITSRQIDKRFGVVRVRPNEDLYAVRVDADVAQRVRAEQAGRAGSRAATDVRVALVH
jgi:hypothetical protein